MVGCVLRVAGAAVFMGAAANAATVTESGFAGDYSGHWRDESVIAGTPDAITGTWSHSNDYDLLHLTGLASGAQTLSVTFSVIAGMTPGYAFSAGGWVLYSESDYRWSAWEGARLGAVNFNYANQSDQTLTLTLGADFGGSLHLGLYGTHGALAYTISGMTYAGALAPPASGRAPAPTPAVPLPAPVVLLGAGLGVLAVFGGRRRA